ncbi:tetratricopeptide repeat protein [Desulfovibrio ferrophilus]|uniref:Tetratricopeptide TPR_3 n=1 Tax=Desulfovibrio ferrophilus TaxID=241368 RepID=A0A2Z6B3C3_9BACT|nr:tetratricopeptide repeat protein [Desulfovibrio ferrophilus]BBD09945.1 tetratricopeptide TPR_3 [Desulfovibrio ferrophilus]
MSNVAKQRLYEKTIVDFVASEDGAFFAVSHDQNFLKLFRQTLNKELIIGTDRIRTLSEENKLLSELKSPFYKDKKPLLVIERVLHNRSMLSFIKNMKTLHEDMHIIVLTSEVERQVLILLHEIGVSNFITKPISVNTLIEKLAFTIKPQGKIGQYIERAKKHLSKGMWDEAIALSDKILDLKPGSAAALMVKGDALKAQGQAETAEASYLEAHKGASLYLEPLKKLAELYKDEGDADKQLTYLKKLDRLSPLNVERKISIGEIHLEFGDQEKAGEYFDQAVVNARKEAQVMIEEVKRSIAEKCLDRAPATAEKFFRSIIDDKRGTLKKSDIETFNRLGMALRRQGRWEDAVGEYEQALKISPDDENLHFNRAVALTEGGKHRQAEQALTRVLDLNPDFGNQSPVLTFNIGIMYSNARKPEEAKRFMERTLKLDPKHKSARSMLKDL